MHRSCIFRLLSFYAIPARSFSSGNDGKAEDRDGFRSFASISFLRITYLFMIVKGWLLKRETGRRFASQTDRLRHPSYDRTRRRLRGRKTFPRSVFCRPSPPWGSSPVSFGIIQNDLPCWGGHFVVRETGLEPVRKNTRPSNVRVCRFRHSRIPLGTVESIAQPIPIVKS